MKPFVFSHYATSTLARNFSPVIATTANDLCNIASLLPTTGNVFGLAALAYDFFRFVSWPHVPHMRAHVQPIRAEKRQPRGGIVAQTCAAHVHRLTRKKMHVQETCAARNQRGQKRNGMPDSKLVGRWQNDRRRILDRRGQAALFRVRPGAFLFDLARLYTQAQRLDQPHHPQQGFFVLARGGCGRGASALPLNASESSLTAR